MANGGTHEMKVQRDGVERHNREKKTVKLG